MHGKWIIPGGGIDFGEHSTDAGKREVKEETNLDVNIKELLCVKEIINVPGDYHGIVFFHLAEVLNPDELKASDDLSDVGFFTIDEIKKMDFIASVQEVLQHAGFWKD